MTAAHAIRGDRRYRYYVSRTETGDGERSWRLPAGDLEAIVVRGIQALLRDPLSMTVETGDVIAARTTFASACALLADRISEVGVLQQLGARIIVQSDRIEMVLDARTIATAIGASPGDICDPSPITLSLAVKRKRRGHELRLVYAAPEANPARRDERMIQLIASGYAAYGRLLTEPDIPSTERSHLVRMARLRFLAPDIVSAIVDGRQPIELTARALLRMSDMPLTWTEQRKALGFT